MADEPKPPPSRQRQTRVIGAVVVAVLLLIFAVQNRDEARVNFLFLHWDGRVIYIIIVSAIAGALAGWLVERARRRGRDRD